MYKIEFKKRVEKDLRKIEHKNQSNIFNKIKELSANPYPNSSSKLVETDSCYRLRVGNYRIIYQVDENILSILIIRIRHRKDVYKD